MFLDMYKSSFTVIILPSFRKCEQGQIRGNFVGDLTLIVSWKVSDNIRFSIQSVFKDTLGFTFSSWTHSANYLLDTKMNPIMPMIPKMKT